VAHNRPVPEPVPSAEQLLRGLIGQEIGTVTGQPNTVLAIDDGNVVVATARSPAGQPVPVEWIQSALEKLEADGEIEISVASLGHRSAFLGAVLLTVPGTRALRTSPPRVRLDADARSSYQVRVAGEPNAWWEDYPEQRFWLEITDRPDIGIDLHCPQRDVDGHWTPGYSLIWWVRHGDVVFHYDKSRSAITGWSRAVGDVVEAPVVWRSHRGAARRRVREAQTQPGWWMDLEGPYPLDEPLTLEELRTHAGTIRQVMAELGQRVSGSLYFPFYLYGGQVVRPMQPYLNKLPAEMVAAFPALMAAPHTALDTEPLVSSETDSQEPVGGTYRPASVSNLRDTRDPFSVDPAVVERGLRGHADTQNALAGAIAAAGMTPLSPVSTDPNFDVAWEQEDRLFVAEVKSLTADNEERQLRLGLRQVLRYRSILAQDGHAVTAVLALERPPQDRSWQELCDELDVVLAAAPNFAALKLGDT
jgi:hypothetical protein